MKEHELGQILNAVKEQVEITVNGNLRDIKKHLEQQDLKLENMESKIDNLKFETAPLIESKKTLEGIRKFLLWVAAPIAIAYAVFKFLVDYFK